MKYEICFFFLYTSSTISIPKVDFSERQTDSDNIGLELQLARDITDIMVTSSKKGKKVGKWSRDQKK